MSVAFTGSTSNYLRITSDLGGLTRKGAKTMAGWVKPANTTPNKTPFCLNDYTGGSPRFKDDATVRGIDGATVQTASLGSYASGTWYYIWFRSDNSTKLTYGYAASGGTSFSTLDSAVSTSTTAIADAFIGCQYAGGSRWEAMNGEICCVRVWDTNLSDAELLSEMKSATPVKTANLRANWRLETGTDLTSTVNSYALTKAGTVNSGSTEPTDISAAAQSIVPHISNYVF